MRDDRIREACDGWLTGENKEQWNGSLDSDESFGFVLRGRFVESTEDKTKFIIPNEINSIRTRLANMIAIVKNVFLRLKAVLRNIIPTINTNNAVAPKRPNVTISVN